MCLIYTLQRKANELLIKWNEKANEVAEKAASFLEWSKQSCVDADVFF